MQIISATAAYFGRELRKVSLRDPASLSSEGIVSEETAKSLEIAENILKDLIETCRGELNRRWYIEGSRFLAQLEHVLIEVKNARV